MSPDPISVALADVGAALSTFGAPHMLIGGLAVIARGIPRQTDDIDAAVWGPGLDVACLLDHLQAAGIEPRIDDALEFAQTSQVLLLRHTATGTPLEISLAWLEFEREALERADRLALAGTTLPVATAEDLVIYKAVAWRQRDRADIERLLRLHGDRVDPQRVLGVLRVFAEAIEAPERVQLVEAMLETAGIR